MSYEIFLSQLDDVEKVYPRLKRKLVDEKYLLAGELDVIDAAGKLWAVYQVEIHYREGFPHRYPSLFETGGKIPKMGDWHVYEDTLACCVNVEPAEMIRCVPGITVTEYIKEEALPYFFNQTHRLLEGYYANGEYAHGIIGIYQFYSEILGTSGDHEKTVYLIHFIATNRRPERTSMCFCGSRLKFRNCHRAAFDKIKQIGDNALLSHCIQIGKATRVLK